MIYLLFLSIIIYRFVVSTLVLGLKINFDQPITSMEFQKLAEINFTNYENNLEERRRSILQMKHFCLRT